MSPHYTKVLCFVAIVQQTFETNEKLPDMSPSRGIFMASLCSVAPTYCNPSLK